MSSWDESKAKILFQELPFYNTFIEKPNFGSLKKSRFTPRAFFL